MLITIQRLDNGRQLGYFGFYYSKERFADNKEFYQDIANEPSLGQRIGVSQEMVKQQLEFSKKFPSDVEHSRLVAQQINIYQVMNPRWIRRGKLLAPSGELESVLSLDLGDLFANPSNAGEHIEVAFNFFKNGDFSYRCKINMKSITPSTPKEYHITSYVLIDGKLVKENLKVARPLFKAGDNYIMGKLPGRLDHLVYTEK